MKDIFDPNVANEVISRIEKLTPATQAQWGKMNVGQMLAHCNVTYDMIYTDKYPKATGFKKFILKALVKGIVVNEKTYKKSSQTAPAFLITDERDFAAEKSKLLAYITRMSTDGRSSFEGKESNSFGELNAQEWNNMCYKHIDHHLTQFGV
jgi:hypothetical protein